MAQCLLCHGSGLLWAHCLPDLCPLCDGLTDFDEVDLTKERKKLEKDVRAIWGVERKRDLGEALDASQLAKVAKKQEFRLRLAQVFALLQAKTGTVAPPFPVLLPAKLSPQNYPSPGLHPRNLDVSWECTPGDLDVAKVEAPLAVRALKNALALMNEEPGDQMDALVLEFGWSFYEANRNNRLVQAKSLDDAPHLKELIAKAMPVLPQDQNADLSIDSPRLNVIFRRYKVGTGLKIHTDVPDYFEESVYGCILENTSEAALEFRRPMDGHHGKYEGYRLNEEPGLCFRQTGQARYGWWHGVDPVLAGERISVTWRWFKSECIDDLESRSQS